MLKRRAIRPERTGPSGNDDGAGMDRIAVAGVEREIARLAEETGNHTAEQMRGVEGRDLAFQRLDQLRRADPRMCRDVVDRLLGIEGGALAAGFGEGVNQDAAEL